MSPNASRVVLLPEARITAAGAHADKVRRYRLARMRLVERRDAASAARPQLVRSYD